MASDGARRAPTLFLSAGEVSGDMHGAHLARTLRQLVPTARLVGVGGPQMAAAGVELVADVTGHSAIGLTEQLPHVRAVYAAFKAARVALAALRPDAVVLVDYQGANMALARHARGLGLATVYYILPQEWLWGFKGGAARVARGVDHLLAVFEREAEVYRRAGGRVSFVGHPLIDILAALPTPQARAGSIRIALLPGSRLQEVERLLPAFLEAGRRLLAARPEARLVLPVAGPTVERAIARAIARAGVPVQLEAGQTQAVLADADVALVASGTATLEAAILGVPCVAAYQVSPLTALVARRLMRGPYVTLPNIVAESAVVPEFLQGQVEPGALAEAVLRLIEDPAARAAQLAGFGRVRVRLGGPGALKRAAEAIWQDAGVDWGMEVGAGWGG